MSTSLRRTLLALFCGLLLIGPWFYRSAILGYNRRTYEPPAPVQPQAVATTQPTALPVALVSRPAAVDDDLRGPVVVDLAHFSFVNRDRFQPLASALAANGVDLTFWLPTVNFEQLENFLDFPELSAALSGQLKNARALVVVSPFFLYSPAEIAVVRQFVEDGGRVLLISDPDITSDAARDLNHLAGAFNLIFREDYLYDTVTSDANFTHIFAGEFSDTLAGLTGSRVAFYGARSIEGATVAQVRTVTSTLSSLRLGQTAFTVAALSGADLGAGEVMALGDFDLFTDPYVERFDNRRMLDAVAGFLAGGQQVAALADFPNFLQQQVALVVNTENAVGAGGLSRAAELQKILNDSGRSLALAPTTILTQGLFATTFITAAVPISGANDASMPMPDADFLYLATYRAADELTPLLLDAGFSLVEEVVTTTVTPAPAPSATPVPVLTPAENVPGQPPANNGTPEPVAPPALPERTVTAVPPETPAGEPPAPAPSAVPPLTTTLDSQVDWMALLVKTAPVMAGEPVTAPVAAITATATLLVTPTATATVTATVTASVTLPVPVTITTGTGSTTVSATVEITAVTAITVGVAEVTYLTRTVLYLAQRDGIRLLADEAQIFLLRELAGGGRLVAVLGAVDGSVDLGLKRLLTGDYAGCFKEPALIVCPVTGLAPAGAAGSGGPAPAAPPAVATETEVPAVAPAGGQSSGAILVVDDDLKKEEGDSGEAALYVETLARAGYQVDVWRTSERQTPGSFDLQPYAWIIWSDGGYANSAILGEALRSISEYLNSGGQVMISSRVPFFGMSVREPVVMSSLIADPAAPPALIAGLPTDAAVALPEGLPAVAPLESESEPGAAAQIVLRRGPDDADPGQPAMVLYSDAASDEPKGARLLLLGMSVNWIPREYAEVLITNTAAVMLGE